MPLNPLTFNKIIDIIGGTEKLEFDFNDTNNNYSISELEKRYYNSVPEVKIRVSKYIERGSIAVQFKKKQGSNVRYVTLLVLILILLKIKSLTVSITLKHIM